MRMINITDINKTKTKSCRTVFSSHILTCRASERARPFSHRPGRAVLPVHGRQGAPGRDRRRLRAGDPHQRRLLPDGRLRHAPAVRRHGRLRERRHDAARLPTRLHPVLHQSAQDQLCVRTARARKQQDPIAVTLMVESSSCSHNRAPKYLTEVLASALRPDTACQMTAFPCQSADEWRSGACFQCPASGCPTVGYLTDLHSGRTGRFYLNTLGENATSGTYCGRSHPHVHLLLAPPYPH